MRIRAMNNRWLLVTLAAAGLAAMPVIGWSAGGNDEPLASAPPASTQPAPDLRQLMGVVNPEGIKRVEVPEIPNMALRGFIKPHDGEPVALLELTDRKELIFVQKGTQIPITVSGHVQAIGHSELSGLDDGSRVPGTVNPVSSGPEQSQIILEVTNLTAEGVTVTAGQERQSIIIH